MGLLLVQPLLLPLLVPDHMEHRAAPDAPGGGHGKEGGRLHLAGQHPQPLPGLPLGLQLIGHRHPAGAVLAVEGVLALDHPGLPGLAQILGRLGQGGEHLVVGHRRKLDGGVLPAGPLHTDGPGGHHHVPALDLQMDAAAGAHPHKGVRPKIAQLLHGDGRRGAADAGGHHAHRLAQEGAGVGDVLPVGLDMHRVVEVFGDLPAPPRVPREDAVPAHLAGETLDVKLKLTRLHRTCLLCSGGRWGPPAVVPLYGGGRRAVKEGEGEEAAKFFRLFSITDCFFRKKRI